MRGLKALLVGGWLIAGAGACGDDEAAPRPDHRGVATFRSEANEGKIAAQLARSRAGSITKIACQHGDPTTTFDDDNLYVARPDGKGGEQRTVVPCKTEAEFAYEPPTLIVFCPSGGKLRAAGSP